MAEEATKFKTLGNECFSAKKYEEAIQHFTKAIELNPNDHVFFSNRSACFASLEQYDKALEDATRCVTLKPDWAKGYTRKGLAEFYLGNYDDAEQTYVKGLELEPTNSQLQEGFQRVKESKASEGGDSPFGKEFMQNAMGKLMRNPETASFFQDPEFVKKIMTIQKNPQAFSQYLTDPKVQKAFQVILSDFGGAGAGAGAGPFGGAPTGGPDADAGAEHSHENCSHDHSHDHGHGHGHHHEEAKKDDHVIIEEEAPTKKPEPRYEPRPTPPRQEPPKPKAPATLAPAEEEKNRGNDEYKKKNFDKAIGHYQKAIELDPKEPIYYNNLAAVYIEQKQYDQAIEACTKAEDICKSGHYDYVKLAKVLARKAGAYGHKGDYKNAIEYYDKSLLENKDSKVKDEMKKIEKIYKESQEKAYVNPELAEQHRLRGNELYGQGKYPDAIKEYEESIKRNPGDAKLFANKATALMKLMEYPTALKDIEKCLEMDPLYVKAYAKKGVIHHFLKEYHKALEAYEKGLTIDPNNEECKSGIEKTRYAIMGGEGGNENKEEQEQRMRRALEDPEIRAIMSDPQTMQLLRNLQEKPQDPNNLAALRDPTVAKKIDKLIAAGILRMG